MTSVAKQVEETQSNAEKSCVKMEERGPSIDHSPVPPQKRRGCIAQFCLYVSSSAQFHLSMAKLHPQNVLISVLIFLVLCSVGIIVLMFAKSGEDEKLEDEAIAMAEETGKFFSDQLDQAILPLFSLAQFVNELDIFKNLSSAIGQAHAPGSLPFIDNDDANPPTHRNITGVCDEPHLVQRFEEIAATVKHNAGMDKVLVNIQLAPGAVVCLSYPLNNTEDFTGDIYMDNTGAIGHDLLNDPSRKFIAEATIPSDGVVIAGPLTLTQCHDCHPTVEKAFIARFPIQMPGTEIVVNGKSYSKWGFAVAIINWNALVERSGVFQLFAEEGLDFQLTRTDKKSDPETNEIIENVRQQQPGIRMRKDYRYWFCCLVEGNVSCMHSSLFSSPSSGRGSGRNSQLWPL
jgi:sensor domain CHASE-containing protein